MSTGNALVVLVVVGVAVLTGGVLFGGGTTLELEQPRAAFDYALDGGNDSLTVIHAGGDAISGERAELDVVVVDAQTGDTVEKVWLIDGNRAVREGDSLTIIDPSVGPGDTVRVVWQAFDAEGDRTAVLDEFELGADER